MTQQGPQPQSASNHFDAARIIVETLKGLDKTAQGLAMRFASETLGLQVPALQGPSAPGSGALVPPSSLGGALAHSTDIKQFTDARKPRTDQQFAAVVAYFYRFEAPDAQKKETIDADALQEAARLASRKRPSNPGMTLVNAKNAGYLDPVEKGKFKISAVGENLVAMTLPGNNEDSSTKRGGGKKKAAKKKARSKKAGKAGR